MGRITDLFAGRSVTAVTERAARRLAAGKLDEAARIVEKGLERYPGSNTLTDLHLSIRRARAHKTMRRLEVRIEARQDSIAYEELIKLYLELELPEEAYRKAEEFVEAHPNRDAPHLLLGEIHLDAFFEDLQGRHGELAHEHLVKAAQLNHMALQPRLLLAELYFCLDARRSLASVYESLRQMAPETPALEAAFAIMEQVADADAEERIEGMFERMEVSGTLARDPADWPLSRRRGSPTPCLEEDVDPVALDLVNLGVVDEIVLLRRDGSVVTHVSPLGQSAEEKTLPSAPDEAPGFVDLVNTVTGRVFPHAGEFDMGRFKRFTIRGDFGNVVVGRIGNVMVGVRSGPASEPLRVWEQVSANLEHVAAGRNRKEPVAGGMEE